MTHTDRELLAWLGAAISNTEADARRWHDVECESHATTMFTMTLSRGGAIPCDCKGPETVRRRCAADREALALYAETVAIRDQSAATLQAAQEHDAEPDRRVLDDWNRANREAAHMLPLIQLLAKGYGWTDERPT